MGGNLLKDITRRHSADEYFTKTTEFSKELVWADSYLPFVNLELIPAYKTKASFGDADIVYSTENDEPFSVTELDKEFNPTRIVKNGEVITLDYKELQIDLIHAKQSCFSYAHDYYSYNDCGNFVGKLARHFGLSHGHKGLYLPIRDEENCGNLIDSVLVTEDFYATLEFVGLDYTKFYAGFETMEDVYRYIQTSPYFSTESYKLENISSIGRIRDRKRESYRNFLKFNESYAGPSISKVEDKTVFFECIFNAFPDAKPRFDAVMKEYVFKKAVREKFNGDIVKKHTGLTDSNLGIFMKHLKSTTLFDPSMIMYLTEDQIRNNIMSIKNEYY